jgi:hypothetical protein
MNKWLMALVLGLVVAATACERHNEERNLPKVDSAVQVNEGDKSGSERDEFVREAQREIDELAAKMAGIRNRTLAATGQAKETFEQQLAELEQEQKIVEAKLASLKSAIGDKWKELKADVTAAIGKFKQSLKNAL